MPASELAWGGEARMPIFQVYGTKRKAPNEEGSGCGADRRQADDLNGAKRVCPWRGDVGDGMCTDGVNTMENNNSLVLQPQQLQQLQQRQQTIPQQNDIPWPQQVSPPLQYLPQATSHNSFSQQVPGGAMDMCGETFASCSETEEALMAMDSDCAQNLEQYRTPESTPIAARSGFCHEFCGVGDLHPTASCVRCYCKPNWEGIMTMRPYISDIY